MRIAVVVALTATVAGCVSSPVQYGASLSPGWGFGVLLGPYSMGLVAAAKEHQQQQRRLLARQVHLQCSSLPLPKDLDFDPQIYAPKPAKYP